MMFLKKYVSHHSLYFSLGILFIAIFSACSMLIAGTPEIKPLGISPLIVAIVLGIIYGNVAHPRFTHELQPGINFCAKRILRLAIILYGFRISFQEIYSIGLSGAALGVVVVITTLVLGVWIGKKLKLEEEITILIAAGAAICGAAAVLATEGVLKSNPSKAAVAVASVVLLGSVGMFLYPLIQSMGWFHFTAEQYGLFSGATIYEVAQVVVAGSAAGVTAGKVAVVVKMLRVMMLAPYLILLNIYIDKNKTHFWKSKIHIPWFAVGFILMIGFNSLNVLSSTIVDSINTFDTFLLVMAMAALGIETHYSKIKGIGIKALYLALILFAWLTLGIYAVSWLFF